MDSDEGYSESSINKELFEIAIKVAQEAGDFALRSRREGVELAATKMNHLDLVTATDVATEELVRRMLFSERPNDRVIGEETGALGARNGVTWLVDPIDGTVNFFYGSGQYAVSLAAFADEEPLAGVVYAPATGDMWCAAKGKGAFHNGIPIARSEAGCIKDPLISTVFSYDSAVRTQQMEKLVRSAEIARDIRIAGSTAIDICRVAAGEIDCFYADTVHWWDIGAGVIIAKESGVNAEYGFNEKSEYVECVISRGQLTEELREIFGCESAI